MGPTRPVVRKAFAIVLQLARGRLAEPAMRDFLKPVTEGKDKQVATDPRRFTVVEPPPLGGDRFDENLESDLRRGGKRLALLRPVGRRLLRR